MAEIPELLIFEQTVVLLLAISTASADLYCKNYLNLPFPEVDNIKSTNKVLLVWDDASSISISTIQLTVASDLTVFTTTSETNKEFIKLFSMHAVFDYRFSTIKKYIS
ncbi:hypothetical protein ASPNIDRAFT_195042, partial [Aspergillus niger ATCC 1015]